MRLCHWSPIARIAHICIHCFSHFTDSTIASPQRGGIVADHFLIAISTITDMLKVLRICFDQCTRVLTRLFRVKCGLQESEITVEPITCFQTRYPVQKDDTIH